MTYESQFTPGPWRVITLPEPYSKTFVAAEPYEGHPYHGCSRTIEIMSDEDYPTKLADAQLISQAPEMIGLCQRIIAYINHPDDKPYLALENFAHDSEEIIEAAG